MIQRGQLYFHTIRHLKMAQIFSRIRRKVHKPRIKTNPTPPVLLSLSVRCPGKARSLIGPRTFGFLGQSLQLNSPATWNDPKYDPLALFNLHYFDDLDASDASLRIVWHQDLLRLWIQQNPWQGGGVGWEAYPISLRVVNWIKWQWRFKCQPSNFDDSLAVQARYLWASLETHLGGNHLWANAKALIFCGLYFSGDEAQHWLRRGVAILKREIPIQVLKDGGHFERSPMYHAIMTQDLLELIEIVRQREFPSLDPALALWTETAGRMLYWAQVMAHPDGQLAFFNDAAFGIAATPGELLEYGKKLELTVATLPQGLVSLGESGYIRIAVGDAVLLADVGAIGPDELPGHAHADTLSFEFSLKGQRLVVNSGTSSYWDQTLRDWQRGTPSHNTVCINGKNSSEVWSRFRVARRARARVLVCSQVQHGEYILQASHNGYLRLRGRPVHTRTWTINEHSLIIDDVIAGPFKSARAHLYFHPSVLPERRSDQELGLDFTGGKVLLSASTAMKLQHAVFYPEFGKEIGNHVAVIDCGATLRVNFKY